MVGMLKIEISIPYPVTTFITIIGIVGTVIWLNGGGEAPVTADATGGGQEISQLAVLEAEQDVRRMRSEQALIERREEILRYQIKQLEEEMRLMGSDEEIAEEFRESVRELVDLLQDKMRSEQEMLRTLQQIKDAQSSVEAIAVELGSVETITITWPVEPEYGISARFLDQDYEQTFGIPHKAIDIPALQGTTVAAAEDGVVEEYVDNGLGYSWITIRHNGFLTLYGHVSESLVRPGDHVWQGDPIAYSGGMPGTKGAGALTTGPHLHFEVITSEGSVDPELYLP